MPRFLLVAILSYAFLLGCTSAEPQLTSDVDALSEPLENQRPLITRKDDLPRHSYRLDIPVIALYDEANRDVLLRLAASVKADIENDMASYDIRDASTIQDYYAVLGSVAMIEGDWRAYQRYLEERRVLESKEANRLTMGIVGETIAKARLAVAEPTKEDIARLFADRVADLDYSVVQDSLKSLKARTEILTRPLVLGNLESSYQPVIDNTAGEISYDIASSLVNVDFTLRQFIPIAPALHEVLAEVIAANYMEKPNIWLERDFALSGVEGGEPVVLAIWDSGVDAAIFETTEQVWRNAKEIPTNGIDDDGNGFIDDYHGIAYDLHAAPVAELLYPIGELAEDPQALLERSKGFGDLQFNIDSEEASALRKTLAALPQGQVKDFLESLGAYGNYSHGTHVAGIAADGNPYARILAGRLTFGYTLMPEKPTVEQAQREARMFEDTIAYFRASGTRVVNMSWGGSLRSVEEALEAHNAGGDPETRKTLAREIYDITDQSLRNAISASDSILFVTSAGNDDNDVRFDEYYPSSYDFDNLLTVGAVDSAGNETSFTSLGKVDIYANGFEVESYVPGGSRIAYNGTSMSSPQVTNLAGKLLALEPKLTTAQLRRLILEGADIRQVGGRTIRLMNPRQSLALLGRQKLTKASATQRP